MKNQNSLKLTWGQVLVLVVTSLPMAAAGVAGGVASYFNFAGVLASRSNALSLVLAGESVALICALVALAVTLMGQHTPAAIRAGLWLAPLAASVAGVVIAPDTNTKVVMGLSPMAMTAAGEGIALVARRIVAFRSGVDLEAQRRAGLLVWHAGRAQNGGWLAQRLSKAAVWRLTKSFASTDGQMHVQVDDIQRYRISENLDVNLTDVLAGGATKPVKATERPSAALTAPAAPQLPAATSEAVTEAPSAPEADEQDDPDGWGFISGVLAEAEQKVAEDPTQKLLTVADVAKLKNVSPGTVRSWVSRGKLGVFDRDDNGRSLFSAVSVSQLD